jgi:hypothetical protein
MEMSNDWETYGLAEQWLPGNAILLCSDLINMHVRQIDIIATDSWESRFHSFGSTAQLIKWQRQPLKLYIGINLICSFGIPF